MVEVSAVFFFCSQIKFSVEKVPITVLLLDVLFCVEVVNSEDDNFLKSFPHCDIAVLLHEWKKIILFKSSMIIFKRWLAQV